MIENFIFFIISCAVLIITGSLLVKSLTYMARFLQLSEFVLAFILMAFSTSLPELGVSISAAISNNPGIVLGTIIGSNIANLTLVAGVTALLGRKIRAKGKLIQRDTYWMLFISVLAVALIYLGGQLSRIDGIILLTVFAIYLYTMIKQRKNYEQPALTNKTNKWLVLTNVILFLVLLPILFVSAKYVVKHAQALSIDLGLPQVFVGLFFIAIGTSLPELAFSSAAAIKKHGGLSLGNLIGSNVVNITVILGIAAIITPIKGNLFVFLTSSFFMLIISLLFAIFIESTKGINWKQGFALIMLYIFFIMVEFTLKGYFIT